MNKPADGVVVIDKPLGMTSHDVVGRMRRVLGMRRVGHAGTLDPDASGVLVIGFGRGTRLLTYLTGDDKDYQATIRLGMSTATDDAAGEIISRADRSTVTAVSDEAILGAVERLRGVISQRPSAVSAIKVDGVRAYARVRAGEDVVLPERTVEVSRFDVQSIRRDETAGSVEVDATFTVSSGTYIRALARDLGASLGIGGHLVCLRRTRSGRFAIGSAVALPEPGDDVEVLDLATALRQTLPCVEVDAAAASDIAHGRIVPAPAGDVAVPAAGGTSTADVPGASGSADAAPSGAPSDRPEGQGGAVAEGIEVGVLSNGDVVAIARLHDGVLHPKAVFASPAP
ncbi:MAG: tRNA pseudouridine(55) synthase TruB [Actinomycetales bacterium]|nr:tRNA pseudouridine(55) synthase TruB [Actinomycetales bacterium]